MASLAISFLIHCKRIERRRKQRPASKQERQKSDDLIRASCCSIRTSCHRFACLGNTIKLSLPGTVELYISMEYLSERMCSQCFSVLTLIPSVALVTLYFLAYFPVNEGTTS